MSADCGVHLHLKRLHHDPAQVISKEGDLFELLVSIEFVRSREKGAQMRKGLNEILPADDIAFARKGLYLAMPDQDISEVLAEDGRNLLQDVREQTRTGLPCFGFRLGRAAGHVGSFSAGCFRKLVVV